MILKRRKHRINNLKKKASKLIKNILQEQLNKLNVPDVFITPKKYNLN